MNDQVRKWGIDVQKVELSTAKVLKHADNTGSNAMGSLLKGLGKKSDQEYPTPQEFVRAAHGLPEEKSCLVSTDKSLANPAANDVPAMDSVPATEIPKGLHLVHTNNIFFMVYVIEHITVIQ